MTHKQERQRLGGRGGRRRHTIGKYIAVISIGLLENTEKCLEFPSVDLPKRKLQFARVQNIQPDVTGFCAYFS